MDKPKTLLGFPIKYTDDLLPIKDGDIKFGGPLFMTGPGVRKVKFINGPLEGRIIFLIDNKVSKIVFPVPSKGGFGQLEYKIRQKENGDWVGE